MKSKRINQKEIKRQDGIINRSRYVYKLIAPKAPYAPIRRSRLHPLRDKLEDTPFGTAVLVGTGAYVLLSSAMMFVNNVSKPLKIIATLSGSLFIAAVGGLTNEIIDRINTHDQIYKKYIEYIEAYNTLENNISQEISDDTRITRSVLFHRRDLYDGIKLRAKDLGYNNEHFSLYTPIYSKKSERQLIEALCAEFGKIHAEFVEDIRKGKLFGISADQIIIDVGTKDALERVKAVSERIDEVFGIFGLTPIFYAGKEVRGALGDMVL